MRKKSIISVSLTENNIENLDRLQKQLGLAGRSEAIRVCLRATESEIRERERLVGDVEGILIVVHKADGGHDLEEAGHEHQGIILTQVHSHLKSGKCLDVFIISGSAKETKAMLAAFEKNESLEYIKFVIS